MTTLEKYRKRHQEVKKQLLAVETQGVLSCEKIGASLEITGQTVRNYFKGEGRDGYLAEAILIEAKKIKK